MAIACRYNELESPFFFFFIPFFLCYSYCYLDLTYKLDAEIIFYVFYVGPDVSGRAAHTSVIIATPSVEDSYSGRKDPWLVSVHFKSIS